MKILVAIVAGLLFLTLPAAFVQAKGVAGFTGTVTAIDRELSTMTVKDGSRVVRFDLANPTLKGFRGLHQIRPGQRVTVRYKEAGIIIAKGSAQIAEPQAAVKGKKGGEKYAAYRPARVQGHTKGLSFEDVDENQDGKVSPVELSVVLPGLTRDQFRTYDRNGDGVLDRAEFRSVGLGK